ncbi:MAG: nucleotidyl transferase AbiEii/AbiGii toxin family protein [Acidobacteria bacterium]|nr:nucleotidyl transferase AbiEii/AbiGii toxin family protein [Acidobacteriota bacterium]
MGFGDVITPAASRIEYPAILNLPAPLLWAFPKEIVIADKLEAMTMLGLLNSRLKDYFDIWLLASLYNFDGTVLSEAIRAAFASLESPIP